MSELERVNENPEFREYMSAEEDNRKIENTMRALAVREGLEKGKKEGLEQGKKELIIDLLKNNVSLEVISKSSGYTIEELNKMMKEI